VRQFAHAAGIDIDEDKAKQLLVQARADYKNRAFNMEDCKRYAEDFAAFQKDASGSR